LSLLSFTPARAQQDDGFTATNGGGVLESIYVPKLDNETERQFPRRQVEKEGWRLFPSVSPSGMAAKQHR
jgi:hypothetical protein